MGKISSIKFHGDYKTDIFAQKSFISAAKMS